MKWFRLYGDMVDDPKIGTLDDHEFRLWIELLCLACKAGKFGDTCLTVDEANWYLRRNVTETLQTLLQRNIVTVNVTGDGAETIHITKWQDRQYQSDNSADRVRKYRERQKKVNCSVSVTLQKRPTDTDTDTDTEINKEPGGSCPELSQCDSSALGEIVFSIPLIKKDGVFQVTESDISGWVETFPAIDVLQELREIRQWNIDNPRNRKTKNGIRKHISGWLSRKQNKAPVMKFGNRKQQTPRQRYMSDLGDALETLEEMGNGKSITCDCPGDNVQALESLS